MSLKWVLALGGAIATLAVGRLAWKYMFKAKKQCGIISKLVIYPIKSCKGIEVSEAMCSPFGLASGLLKDR